MTLYHPHPDTVIRDYVKDVTLEQVLDAKIDMLDGFIQANDKRVADIAAEITRAKVERGRRIKRGGELRTQRHDLVVLRNRLHLHEVTG